MLNVNCFHSDVVAKCRALRIASGDTVKMVADDLGYHYSNISKFEHGKNYNITILFWYVIKYGYKEVFHGILG